MFNDGGKGEGIAGVCGADAGALALPTVLPRLPGKGGGRAIPWQEVAPSLLTTPTDTASSTSSPAVALPWQCSISGTGDTERSLCLYPPGN